MSSETIFGSNTASQSDEENHWLSVSDLMAGLMMVFLFISIVLMRNALLEKNQVQVERDKIKEIAATYKETKVNIYESLKLEFKDDLKNWDAEIKKDLSFNFKSPEVLFSVGKKEIKPKFKHILSDFFPRYLSVISKYKKSISEVRIEGHTSSRWNGYTSKDKAYFMNMDLSQGRTRSVLSYLYHLNGIATEREWIKKNIAAVGYSSAKTVIIDGKEDPNKSRRVSFKINTNSEVQILKIISD